MKKLSKNELEGMLPDYIFEKLSPEDTEAFEKNAVDYPELLQDINDARSLFARINATEFDKTISRKTRNIGVKVRQRMSRKEAKFGSFQLLTRFILPAAAVLAIFAYTIFVQQNAKDGNTSVDLISERISIDEMRELISKDDEFNIGDISFSTLAYKDHIYESQSEYIQEIYYDELLNNYEQVLNYLNSKITYSNTKILLLSTVDEDEFQDILKELENVGKIF